MATYTYTPKRLVGVTTLTASLVNSYAAPTNGAVIKQILFNNTSSSAVTVSAYIGSSSAPSTIAGSIIYNLSVGPNSQLIWAADIPLIANEVIWLVAGTASVVNVVVSGIEIS